MPVFVAAGCFATARLGAASGPAGLRALRGVDAVKPYACTAHLERVTVDDACARCERCFGRRSAGSEAVAGALRRRRDGVFDCGVGRVRLAVCLAPGRARPLIEGHGPETRHREAGGERHDQAEIPSQARASEHLAQLADSGVVSARVAA